VKKSSYERLVIVLASILSILLTSFWTVPFVMNLSNTSLSGFHQGAWLWSFSGGFFMTSVAAFFIPLAFFVTFYYYWRSNHRSRKELVFFSPVIILCLLFFFRITPLIPILNNISPDPFMVFFMFFTIYFFLNTRPDVFKGIVKLIPWLLITVVVASVGISHFKTPYFIEHSPVDDDTIELLKSVDGQYVFVNAYENSYARAYYSYAAIYLDKSTPDGYYRHIVSYDYYYRLKTMNDYLKEGDCESFISETQYFNITNLIAYEDYCQKLEECGFNKVKEEGIVCLYKIK